MGSRCDATICLTDFFATCADVVGAELGDGAAEDSFSLMPLIAGDEDAWRREPVIHHSANGMFAVRLGKWKLVAGNGSGGRQRPRGKPFGKPYQLFALDADWAEARDGAAANAEVVAQMAALLERMRDAGRSR